MTEATTPERLLDCALVLVSVRGWPGVGVQEIAAAAGVTKPSLYHHFGSKRGLLDALLERIWLPFLDNLERTTAFRGDVHGSLEAVVGLFLEFVAENPLLHRLIVAFAVAPPGSEEHEAVLPFTGRRLALLEALFTAAGAQHGNLAGHHATFALTLQGMLDVHTLYALQTGAPLDDALRYRIVKQFMYGMWSL